MKKLVIIILIVIFVTLNAQNYIGDGGKGISLAMLPASGQGLTETDNYLPNMIQGALIANFVKFSAISVVDRLKLETVLHETESGIYATDADYGRLGQVASVDCILTGTITKTQSGYTIQLQIIETRHATVGRTRASFSEQFTLTEVENAIAINKASLELLTQLGVRLTESAKNELKGSEPTVNIDAQRALARGIVAQKQGTEVSALSYFYQAAAFDPSLLEATNRSSILQANISTNNIGVDLRNDVARRKRWVDRLTELENHIHNINHSGATPFIFYYTSDIHKGNIDYKKETATLSIESALTSDDIRLNSISKVVKMVFNGLNSTGRKSDWGLADWPSQQVTKLKPFTKQKKDFTIVIELMNDKQKSIGRETIKSSVFWEMDLNDSFKMQTSPRDNKIISFKNVNINDITENLSLKIISVNGKEPEAQAQTGVLQIVSGEIPLGVGGKGPAGGIIFYDKGEHTEGWRFLEAAPNESELSALWGTAGINVAGTKTAIGTGKDNTKLIINFLTSNSETGKAAQLSTTLNINNYNDWFLPSKDELDQIYKNLKLKGFGKFKSNFYWSSSQYHGSNAWGQYFGSGVQSNSYKDFTGTVLAIRAF